MTGKNPEFPDDKTGPERRKNLTHEQIDDLELAGGVEGGMRAGSAGGPGSNDKKRQSDDPAPKAKPE